MASFSLNKVSKDEKQKQIESESVQSDRALQSIVNLMTSVLKRNLGRNSRRVTNANCDGSQNICNSYAKHSAHSIKQRDTQLFKLKIQHTC